ncbi:MAG TPA: ectonucleotide pyrophosphatase/phosphodiesterase [Blastocatellia bacterium]|nr:ectonucleotide pyrophosphatase/phosphodiesterase [Blastocatellia bacterium]
MNRARKETRSGSGMRIAAIALVWLLPGAIGFYTPARGQPQTVAIEKPRVDAHLVMISIDGLVPDYYLSPASIGLRAPNLIRMKLDGAYAEGVEGVYPSVTYPAHTTMVTGVRPASHGIVQNRIFEAPTEPQTREWYWFSKDLKCETVWGLAKKAGLVTAAVGWPVTVGADIDYNVPEIKDPAENPPTAKRTLQYSTPGLVGKAVGLGAGGDTTTDGRRTAISEYIITTYKPNLMLIHFIALDDAHHKNGTRTPAAIQVAERLDGYLGRVIDATRKAGIFDRTTFVLVSDHGFAGVEKKFEPNVLLAREKLITLDGTGTPRDWKAAAWPAGGSCAIVLRDPNDKETRAKVESLFAKVAARSNGPLSRVLGRDEMKKLGAIPSAALMLDAAPGFVFGEAMTGPEIHESKEYRGTHGQLPSRAEMRSALIVYGQAAQVGARVALARMIDIAPTAAALLGLTMDGAEGRPITELVKPGFIPPAPPRRATKARQPPL